MSKEQMDRVKKSIESLMIKDVATKINERLSYFEKDDRFCQQMGELTNLERSGITSIMPVIDSVIMGDYVLKPANGQEPAQLMNPIPLSPFYRVAMSNGASGMYENYTSLVKHVKSVIGIDEKIMTYGVKNDIWQRNPVSGEYDFDAPVSFDDSSYSKLLFNMFSSKPDSKDFKSWLSTFKEQFSKIKESYELGGLINLGYMDIVSRVQSKAKTPMEAENMFEHVNSIFKKLETKRFNVYDSSTINFVKNSVGDKLASTNNALDLYNQNTLIQKFGLKLTTDM